MGIQQCLRWAVPDSRGVFCTPRDGSTVGQGAEATCTQDGGIHSRLKQVQRGAPAHSLREL